MMHLNVRQYKSFCGAFFKKRPFPPSLLPCDLYYYISVKEQTYES